MSHNAFWNMNDTKSFEKKILIIFKLLQNMYTTNIFFLKMVSHKDHKSNFFFQIILKFSL